MKAWRCRVLGHKWDGYFCSRCWPDGVPEEILAALLGVEEAFQEAKRLLEASVK